MSGTSIDGNDQAKEGRSSSLEQLVQIYRVEFLPLCTLFAEMLKDILEKAAKDAHIRPIVQARSKSIPNFAEKVVRKNYHDPFVQMTDLCGARVIVGTDDQIEPLRAFVRRWFIVDERNTEDTASRLSRREFGYRSIHLVVSLRQGSFVEELETARIRLTDEKPEWKEILAQADTKLFEIKSGTGNGSTGLANKTTRFKAEIQLRTLLQHAWAAVSHNQFYKGEFDPPPDLERQHGRIAALLEEAEASFCRIRRDLLTYQTHHGPYRKPEQRRDEIRILREILMYDPKNLPLALKITRITNSSPVSEWASTVKLLDRFVQEWKESERGRNLLRLAGNFKKQRDFYEEEQFGRELQELSDLTMALALRDYGWAMWKQGEAEQGRTHLQWARLLAPKLIEAAISLGDTFWEEHREMEALKHFEDAVRISLSDPRAWRKYLYAKIIVERERSFVSALGPVLESAIEVCRNRARILVYLPHAYFDIGFFQLLLDRPYEALAAYAKGVSLCEERPEEIVHALEQITRVKEVLAYHDTSVNSGPIEWVRRLLLLGISMKGSGGVEQKKWSTMIESLCTQGREGSSVRIDPVGSVVIVAGGTLESEEERIISYEALFREAFTDLEGIVYCGGTTAGISGLVARLPLRAGKACRMAYLPKAIPPWTNLDQKNYQFRYTEGVYFSPLEPLQSWIDLLADGVKPNQVRLIGVNGGAIAAFEFRLALALGAKVAVFPDSGRAASAIVCDEDWIDAPNLIALPRDKFTLKELLAAVPDTTALFGPEYREKKAKDVHQGYLDSRVSDLTPTDPALHRWEALDKHYKESNRRTVDHILVKLRAVKMTIRRPGMATAKKVILTQEQLELLAEIEHGRWNAEKLLAGWKYAEKKDKPNKRHNLLVPWSVLSEEQKEEGDRKQITRLIEELQCDGFEIMPENP